MSPETMLGVMHYCMAWHGGQTSREYRVLCRVLKVFQPSGSEEYLAVVTTDGYEKARAVYESLVLSMQGDTDFYGL